MEIIQERLSREFDLNLIATAPSVIYKMELINGTEIEIHNPVDMPGRGPDRGRFKNRGSRRRSSRRTNIWEAC